MPIHVIDRIFSIGVALLGVYIAASAPSYGYFSNGVPGSGYFPFWIGLLIVALSIVNFVRSVAGKEQLTEEFDTESVLKSAGIVVSIIAFLLTVDVLGIVADSALLILLLGWVIRPRWDKLFAAKIAATAIIFPIVVNILFGSYLQVPLPVGILGF